MRKRKAKAKGASLGESVTSLSMQAQQVGWPTPDKSTGDRGPRSSPEVMYREDGSKIQRTLNSAAQLASWPTPQAGQADSGYTEDKDGQLTEAVLKTNWPTPTSLTPSTQTNREAGDSCNLRKMRLLVSGPTASGSPAPTESRGQLNPAHSRWLMGYPVAWDDCAATVTRSSRKSPPASSKRRSRRGAK